MNPQDVPEGAQGPVRAIDLARQLEDTLEDTSEGPISPEDLLAHLRGIQGCEHDPDIRSVLYALAIHADIHHQAGIMTLSEEEEVNTLLLKSFERAFEYKMRRRSISADVQEAFRSRIRVLNLRLSNVNERLRNIS